MLTLTIWMYPSTRRRSIRIWRGFLIDNSLCFVRRFESSKIRTFNDRRCDGSSFPCIAPSLKLLPATCARPNRQGAYSTVLYKQVHRCMWEKGNILLIVEGHEFKYRRGTVLDAPG